MARGAFSLYRPKVRAVVNDPNGKPRKGPAINRGHFQILDRVGDSVQASEYLRFGPYSTPRIAIGAIVVDVIRGEVEIVRLSESRIRWPIGKRERAVGPIVYGDLAIALRLETGAAIQYWWGVSFTTVTKWRKALGVPRSNPGSHIIWRNNAKARAAALPSRLGRKHNSASIENIRAAQVGRKRSTASIAKQIDTRRLNGKPGGHGGVPWTDAEDVLVRTLQANEAAIQTGRTIDAVYARRKTLGIAKKRTCK